MSSGFIIGDALYKLCLLVLVIQILWRLKDMATTIDALTAKLADFGTKIDGLATDVNKLDTDIGGLVSAGQGATPAQLQALSDTIDGLVAKVAAVDSSVTSTDSTLNPTAQAAKKTV